MVALHIGGSPRTSRLNKARRPEWVLSFIFAFLVTVLLGAFPMPGSLADADAEIPINPAIVDGADTGIDDPEESDDEKLLLSVATAASEIRKVVWTSGTAQHTQPFFTGGRYTLPDTNAPPGNFI